MSKDKPEVGDVWLINQQTRCYIIKVDSLFVSFISPKRGVSSDFFTKDVFLEKAKYLGKSKMEFGNLFKTENE